MTANRDIRRQIPSVDRVLRHSQDLVSQWGHDRVSSSGNTCTPNAPVSIQARRWIGA